MPSTHAMLLRGVNVGGKNRLPMKDLTSILESLGCRDVKTYIQSGNAVFQISPAGAKDLAARASAAIAERLGLEVPVVVRTRPQMAGIVAANPFLAENLPAESLHVLFLAGIPKAEALSRLDPDRSPPDAFRVVGSEVYAYLPNGVSNSKLTQGWFESKLGLAATGRNWRTVTTVLSMMES